MALHTLDVTIKLNEVYCQDEIDGFGNAEPYLWRIFFKIDGDTVSLTNTFKLSGNATIHTVPGSHGNLNVSDVRKNTHVIIPPNIGEWQTTLKPIPAPQSIESLKPDGVSGYIGVVCFLMEEDNVSDNGAEAGHVALNNNVQAALDNIIASRPFTNLRISKRELKKMKNNIRKNIDSAIIEKQSIFKNLWSFINFDDEIGTKIFLFGHDDLASKPEQKFSIRWKKEGDWELKGHIVCCEHID